MINYPLKDHISYYFNEKNKTLKENFYRSVLFQIFNQYFEIVLKKYNVIKDVEFYDDLKQELHIHAFKKLEEIRNAADNAGFLITISKNFIINYLKCRYLKCRTTISIYQTHGEN